MADTVHIEIRHWCERLYEEKSAQLILYGRALGLSHCEAEDVLQETFIALLQLAEIPQESEHYIVRSYRNRAFNYRRSLWRRLAREFECRRWFEPADDISSKEQAAMRCLERLPVAQREIIVLKIWHGFSFLEIGNLLGISPNTASGRYRYGIQKLQALLKDTHYEFVESLGEPIAALEAPTAWPEP
jgi:RNA polymerase sigma-70 factor (ECF subfamily)